MATTIPGQTDTTPTTKSAIHVTAVQMGVVAGVLAVAAGAFFDVRPPEAYGVCMACHGRDLVNWIVNRLAHTHLAVAPASLGYPALTTIGVFVGAVLSARASGEFRWRRPESLLKSFGYGALVMNLALLAGGCSFRLLLRATAGDALGLMGFGGMVAGVILGTFWLRWRATR